MVYRRVVYFILFIVVNFHISTIYAEEESIVEMLKKKVVALDDSLTMDIRLLRQDIKKNSEEFKRVSKLLGETLAALNEGELQPIEDPVSQNKQLEVIQDFEQAMNRVKRAFGDEKAVLKKFTSTMKTEIDHLSGEINKALADFRISNIEAKNEANKNLESFKSELTDNLNKVMVGLTNNLTTSVEKLSSDIATETKHAVLTMKNISENLETIYSLKTSVQALSRNMSQTSEQINQIEEQLKAFEGKFDKIFGLRLKKVKEYFVGNVSLKNVTQTINTIGGRLEVRHNGQWGTICDDEFEMIDANVACTMLGFLTAHSIKGEAFYGQGTGPIWLDNLACSGTELSLFECGHYEGIGVHNCGHTEDVGVVCDY